VYPAGIFWRTFNPNGTMMITARPLGTMNQTSPEVPQVYAWADDSITAIDHVQTEMSDATPNPKPSRRPEITKLCVVLTAPLTARAMSSSTTPGPKSSAYPNAPDCLMNSSSGTSGSPWVG
jgi:hypothetical protein